MESSTTKSSSAGISRFSAFVLAAVTLCVGLGAGIGIGAGIWKDDGSGNASIRSEDVCDASNEHDSSLITYILSVGEFEISRKPGEEFVEVYVPEGSLPPVMPYVVNDVKNGTLFQNLLNTTMFLEDWSVLSSQANASAGEFAMPAYAAAKQCYKDYQYIVTSSPAPANAMIVFHDEDTVERLSHVYSVSEEPGGFLFTVLPVTDQSPETLPEGQCHSYQNLSSPHFHHASTCLQYDANWAVSENKVAGSGLTAFIKFGPILDSGAAALVGDLVAGGASDAATDAAVDVASDVASDGGSDAASDIASDGGSDAASDVNSDAGSDGYNGDDIVSDASSDMDMSDTDTVFSNDDNRGGPGAGTVAVGTGVVSVGTGVAISETVKAPSPAP